MDLPYLMLMILGLSISIMIGSKFFKSRINISTASRMGSERHVGRVLNLLVQDGALVKAGYGIYVKARKSSLTSNYIPVISMIQIGLKALAKRVWCDTASARIE